MQNRHSFRLKGYDYSREGLYFITICCYKHDCYFGNTGLPPNNNKIVLNDCGKIAMKCWFEIPEHFPHVKLHEFVVMPNHIHGIIEILPNIQNNVLTHDVGAKKFSPIPEISIPIIKHDYSTCDVGAKNFSPIPEISIPIIKHDYTTCDVGAKKFSPPRETAMQMDICHDDGDGANGAERAKNGDGAERAKNGDGMERAKNFSPLRDTAIPNKPKICGTSMTIGSIIRGYKIGVTKWFRENTQFHHVWQRNFFEHIIRDEKGYLKISEYIQNNPANWNTDKFYQYQL